MKPLTRPDSHLPVAGKVWRRTLAHLCEVAARLGRLGEATRCGAGCRRPTCAVLDDAHKSTRCAEGLSTRRCRTQSPKTAVNPPSSSALPRPMRQSSRCSSYKPVLAPTKLLSARGPQELQNNRDNTNYRQDIAIVSDEHF